MKRKQFYTLLMFLMMLVMPAAAQVKVDKELESLISAVTSLRQADAGKQKTAYQVVTQTLTADQHWTPMDELRDRNNNECRVTDKTMSWFKLNSILNTITMKRNGLNTSRGDFLNGEDPHFSYSLIEKSVKAGKTVSYDMKGREGSQDFVVVPYDTQKAKLDVVLYKKAGNKKTQLAKGSKGSDGHIYVQVKTKVKADDVLTLEISNRGTANAAMVILNHNKRK